MFQVDSHKSIICNNFTLGTLSALCLATWKPMDTAPPSRNTNQVMILCDVYINDLRNELNWYNGAKSLTCKAQHNFFW